MRPAAPGLSNEEVARVLRRAADLDAQAAEAARAAQVDPTSGGLNRFDPTTVERAALEVGLSREAVHQALAELGSGALGGGAGVTRFEARVARNQAVQARLVASPPQLVHARLDPYLRRQTFAPSRRQAQWAVYRQRRDLVSRLRRLVNFSGTLQLAGVETVTVSVLPANPAGSGNYTELAEPAAQVPGSAPRQGVPLHMVRLEGELAPAPQWCQDADSGNRDRHRRHGGDRRRDPAAWAAGPGSGGCGQRRGGRCLAGASSAASPPGPSERGPRLPARPVLLGAATDLGLHRDVPVPSSGSIHVLMVI